MPSSFAQTTASSGASFSGAKPFQISLAPDQLWQAINPLTVYQQGAQFGFINIDFGQTAEPNSERAILANVASYGRQLGHIGDALEVVLDHINLVGLSQEEEDAVEVLRSELAKIRQLKRQGQMQV